MSDQTNTDDETLPIAAGDEKIGGDSLQASIDALRAMASALDADIAAAPDVDAMQAIGRVQTDLTSQALRLVGAQITLLAGQAKVSAAQINAATQYAADAVAAMAEWKLRIVAAGKVVDFIGACLTGNGTKMVETAFKLKSVL
jgi:hypothetical protein